MSILKQRTLQLIYVIPLLALTACSLFNVVPDKKESVKNRKPPLISLKPYNYDRNERVHLKVRGFKDCKLNVDGESMFFSTRFRFSDAFLKENYRTEEDAGPYCTIADPCLPKTREKPY